MTDDTPTPQQTQNLAHRIDVMLPGIQASDERDARRNRANGRRLDRSTLTAAEVIADLHEALDRLIQHINEYHEERNRFIQTPEQMLAYAERCAFYILHDYPRELEGNASVTALWDAFDRIHTGPHEWRKGAYPYDSAPAIVESVHRMAQDAKKG